MNILDRAIARQFLTNALALFVVVFSLVVAVDAVMNLDRYANRAARLAGDAPAPHRALLIVQLVLDLWRPRLLQLFVYLNPLVLVAAAGFTCARLVRSREFVAMLSSGISLHRAGAPILVVGAVMIAAQVVVQEAVLPRVGHLLPRDPADAGAPAPRAFPLPLMPDPAGRLWYARRVDAAATILDDPAVWQPDASGRYTRAVLARRAEWDGKGWNLEGGFTLDAAEPGHAALPTPQPVGRIDGGLDPARIKVRALKGFAGTLSWRQLTSLLAGGADARTAQMLDRARWSRPAGAASAFLSLWAATALLLVRAPRPMIGPALKASAVALAGFVAVGISSALSMPGLPTWLGAFLPAVVMLAAAAALVSGVET